LKGFGKTRQSRSWSSRSPVELLGKSWREMLTALTQCSWILVWHWPKPRMPTSWNLIGIISPLRRTRRSCWRQIRNPTIEEQALARIHRIGQKKEVTTIRFFVKDTFEEVSSLIRSNGIRASGWHIVQRVMEIQKSKKDLASLLFSPREQSQAGNIERLEVCL
jgi:hypothetical protein